MSTARRKRPIACHHGPTNTYVLRTPIGDMDLETCPKGIHSLQQVQEIDDSTFKVDMSIEVSLKSQLYQDNGYVYKSVLMCIQWLNTYFHNKTEAPAQTRPNICFVHTKKGSFTEKVWRILADEISFARIVSYGQLATMCGNVNTARAVGHTLKMNPIQLIIPCHRVIRQTGQLGEYCGGRRNLVKKWLLNHEGVAVL
ncbi:methylated-DNA--protein-cysteine methyltransferase-like [Tubulanus polymorphus]|uniref:methylated-DNA--protein-cysteine methyltransferase-like n=1 Tax=Tubulanus polymorphus TaxID=672921 RepID=UPI003DA5B0C7